MEQDIPESKVAVYLHIPFCLSKCGYCSFFSIPFRKDELDAYHKDVLNEIKLWQQYDSGLRYSDTIYFGGGTPSLLNAEQISQLCGKFYFDNGTEISLEINPIQITESYLNDLRQSPVNRLSIGLQSMLDRELEWLERRHRRSMIGDKIKMLNDFGYTNYSLDLMYGLPGSNLDNLRQNLMDYVELAPPHISCYLLSLDESSEWVRQEICKASETEFIEDDYLADSYNLIRDGLLAAGYEQYEISNFAKKGYESKHNLHYWRGDHYLGLGAGASGYIDHIRYSNPDNLFLYKECLDKGSIFNCREIGNFAESDYIMMRMRLCEGLNRSESIRRLKRDIWLDKAAEIAKLTKLGLLEVSDTYLRLSPSAYFISNSVIAELI